MGASWKARLQAWGRNVAALVLGLAVLCALLEIGLRLTFWSNDARALVYVRAGNAINGFGDDAIPRRIPEGETRLLMLGGSAFVTREFQPQFERLLNDSPRLRELGAQVRVVSTGVPAHMTFDSLWKYRHWYGGYDFDLVVFYHGINDTRANCYPAAVFRDDYAQMPYFRLYSGVFGWMERNPILARSFVVTWVYKLVTRASVQWAPRFQRQAPYNDPRNDPWLTEGAEVKTAATFERNVEAVVQLCRKRHQRLLLLSYASYVPTDYTNERFQTRNLDYAFADESVAVEVWGLPQNVLLGLTAHNDVVRRVAARNPDVLFVDMDRAIPKDGDHFIDVCHWTNLGRATFAREVEAVLVELLSSRPR